MHFKSQVPLMLLAGFDEETFEIVVVDIEYWSFVLLPFVQAWENTDLH